MPVLILFLLAAGLAALVIGLSSMMGPRGHNTGAKDPYEGGIVPTEPARRRFPVRFALMAMLFLVFDIEAVFFYPWAVIFQRSASSACGDAALHRPALVGYIYAYKKGALNWE